MIQIVNDKIENSPNPILMLCDIEDLSKHYDNIRMGKCLVVGNGEHEFYKLACIKNQLQYTSLERSLKSFKKLILYRGIYFVSIQYREDIDFMRFLYILIGIFHDMEVYFTVYKNGKEKICISCIGHRPSYLWGYDLKDSRYLELFNKLKNSLSELMQKNKGKQFHIISGVAQGTEQLFCVAALRLREQYPIHLECVIPYMGYERTWPNEAQNRYMNIIKSCNQRTYLDKKFDYYSLEKKNRYILKRSDYVLVHCLNESDGIKDSIELAKNLRKEMIYL